MSVLDRLDSRPTSIVLVGRGISQAGLFAFLILPAFRLTDSDFNAFTIAVTVSVLLCVAPSSAFQLHLVRRSERAHPRDLCWLIAAGAIGGSLSIPVIAGLGAWRSWMPGIVLAGVVSLVVVYTASLLAVQGRFGRSAFVEAINGCVIGAIAGYLFLVDASPARWAAGLLVAQCLSIALAVGLYRTIEARSCEGQVGSPRGMLLALRGAGAMIAVGIAAMAYNRIDYLVLSQVGTAEEAARYAIAGRIVGPMLVVLGSLNNSLYVRQVSASRTEAGAVTRAVAKRVVWLTVVLVPPVCVVVIVLNGLLPAFEHWRLLLPVALLAVAVIPYALAVPYSYALAAHGHEKVWLVTLGIAVVADAIAVALIARTATAAAALWLLVQIAVSFGLLRSARRLGFIASRTRASGMTSERLEGPAL